VRDKSKCSMQYLEANPIQSHFHSNCFADTIARVNRKSQQLLENNDKLTYSQ
jgi:hypothetical protein